MKTSASRMQHLAPHFFATLSARLAQMQAAGQDVIRLDEGSPDLPPASFIIETLVNSARQSGNHGYQPHRGPAALRQAWVNHYQRQYDVILDPDSQVVPLLGSKEGIFHLMQAVVDPGDVVIIPDPGYITYTRGTLFAGGEPYYLPVKAERGFLPDFNQVPAEILKRARLLWLNYPNNPTGAVASLEFFTQAVEFARRHDLLICHDAAYALVTFDGYTSPSILQVPGAIDVALEISTLSKSHNMAGWRVGAALGQPQVAKQLFTLKTNADSSHFLPVLHAATAALQGDQAWLEARNHIYCQRRDLVVDTLQSLGVAVDRPKGSLYVWFAVPPGWTSIEFCDAVLDQALLSLTPGTVFGPGGEGYVRLSFTAPVERIGLGMERLARAWQELIERRGS